MSKKLIDDAKLASLIRQGLSIRKMARELGVSTMSVRHGMKRLKLPKRQPKSIEEEVAETQEKHETSDLKKRYRSLLSKVAELTKARDAFRAVKQHQFVKVIKPIPSSGTNEATCLLLASDWHVEEMVRPASVAGRNEYNLDIAEARANEYFVAAVKLLKKEQRQISIPNIVLWLGGDFVTGNIHEENLENCQMQPIQATLFAKRLIASGLRYVLAETNCKINIVCSVGNHSRMTKKVHWSTESGNSLEFFLYHALADEFKNEQRIKWVIEEGYHTFLDVYDYRIRFHHGHAIRYLGGIGGLFVPALRAIAQWNRGGDVYLDCFGHLHTQVHGGNFLANGSLIGYNAFAVSIKAPFEPPKQWFALIDRKRGLTTTTPIVFSR